MLTKQEIENNLKIVQENIAAAEKEAGAEIGSTTLVAVTKKQPKEILQIAAELGITAIGENYIQEAIDKFEELGWVDSSPVRRHFIGHLQSNKAKQAVKYFDVIESVDSLKLLTAIDNHAKSQNKIIDVMLQVNISGEEQKSGMTQEEIVEILPQVNKLKNVNLLGIMTIGSIYGQKNEFFLMKNLFSLLQSLKNDDIIITCISMGMSNDYVEAILNGSTHVRIGSSIFGIRS